MEEHEISDYPTTQSSEEVILRDSGKIYLFKSHDLMDSVYGKYLRDVCTFSQMCAEIYVDDDANLTENNKELDKNKNPGRWPQRAEDAGWEKLDWQAPEITKGYNLKTLKYAVWIDRANKRAVVVFRGTAGFVDWWSNAHWLTRFVPGVNNHYKQVRHMVESTLEFIRSILGDEFLLYTTGHSLGGGLAQLFAYASSHRAEFVCAFHSSPVTGYYEIPRLQREQASEGLHIARVFEHGEVLSYPRLLLRKLYPVSTVAPRISEFRTNFIGGGFVTQHSVATFADNYNSKLGTLDNGSLNTS